MKDMMATKTRSGGVRQPVVRAWLATDENNILSGKPATCLFFGMKPRLRMGWWQQVGRPNGRWPVPNITKQKRGEMVAVTIWTAR